jgi:hypothetical protein
MSGAASGQSAAGQLGTQNNPVDVEGSTVNATSVSTDDATVNQALSANDLSLSNDPLNPTIPLSFVGNDAQSALRVHDQTVNADNTATIIETTNPSSDGVNTATAYFFVHGRQQGAFVGFFDLVSVILNRNPTAHLQNSRTTISRTFSVDNNGRLTIAIDDPGETYDVSVTTIAADRS